MFRFFKELICPVRAVHAPQPLLEKATSELLDILLLDLGVTHLDPTSGLDFYKKNAHQPINIYSTIEYCGEKRSILMLCVRFNRETLLKYLFENETVQKTLPDWDIVYQALFGAIKNKRLYSLLLEFYMPKLSPPSKKDISSYLLAPSGDDNEKFDFHFSAFPHQELWRLFIDGVKQQNEPGWLEYVARQLSLPVDDNYLCRSSTKELVTFASFN